MRASAAHIWSASSLLPSQMFLTWPGKMCDNRHMQLDIPNDDYNHLATHAAAAGFADVAAYVVALSEVVSQDPRGSLPKAQFDASVGMLNQSFADETAGRTEELRSAFRDIATRQGIAFER